jgi:hypothetical protein
MTRRTRLRKCKFWRRFVMDVNNSQTEEQAKDVLWSFPEVSTIQIEHGWTTWVTVELKNGESFIERQFWAADSLKKIGKDIYKYAVREYFKTYQQ